MGWPKGKPRKGHINKDGTEHSHWGTAMSKRSAKTEPTTPKRRGRPPKDPDRKVWNTKLTNKGLDKCPECGFPEAYGGYCEECGWMERIGIGKW